MSTSQLTGRQHTEVEEQKHAPEDKVQPKEFEEEKHSLTLEASAVVTVAAHMDYCRLRVTGKYSGGDEERKITTKKDVVLVVDTSGSMSGSRMRSVREAVEPFLNVTLEDPSIDAHVISFNHTARILPQPRTKEDIGTVMAGLTASGGTNFHQAAIRMHKLANELRVGSPRGAAKSVVKPSVRTALCIIPPKEVWGPIQEIRKVHDPGFVRWMPHINICFPFVEEADFETQQARVAAAISDMKPIEVVLSKFGIFPGKQRNGLYGFLTADNEDRMVEELAKRIFQLYPKEDKADGNEMAMYRDIFHPHLTVGQFKKNTIEETLASFQQTWKPISFTIDRVYMISRRGDEPFQIRHEIPLGKPAPPQPTLDLNPEIALLICSDGEVPKSDAQLAHKEWKKFVAEYTASGRPAPYCDCIGVSRSHDADVLAGFIQGDENGNYTRADGSAEVKAAFEKSMANLSERNSMQLPFHLPFPVATTLYGAGAEKLAEPESLMVVNGQFSYEVWVPQAKLEGEGMAVLLDKESIAVEIRAAQSTDQMALRLDYEEARVKDMLRVLRETQDRVEIHRLARKIDADAAIVQGIKLVSPETLKLREQLASLMGELTPEEQQQRADLMRTLRASRTNPTKELRKRRAALVQLCSNVRQLCREVRGGTRLQEIRQHILELHFKTKHAKRAERLAMSDEELERREARYKKIEKPALCQVQDLTDDIASGCFLSTLSMRDVAADADSLWICGRVNREGGIGLTRPECTRIEYVSPFLVSGSYFQMALDVAPKGFVDGAREIVNARLCPVYGNSAHFKCTRPYLEEALAHTAAERTDVRVPDKGLLFAVVGRLIEDSTSSEKSSEMLFRHALPALEMLADNDKVYPLDQTFQPAVGKPKVTLRQFSKCRLLRYLEDPTSRCTSLVANTGVLWADALLNPDVALEGRNAFWFWIALQSLRGAVKGSVAHIGDQIGCDVQEGKVAQCILRGLEDEEEQEDVYYGAEIFEGYNSGYFKVPDGIGYVDPTSIGEGPGATNAFDAAACKHSQMEMCQQVLGRVDWSHFTRAVYFFKALHKIGLEGNMLADPAAFKCPNFENNFDSFVLALGMEDALSGASIRALCGFAVEHYHKSSFKSHAEDTNSILSNPCEVLENLHLCVLARFKERWKELALEEMRKGANKERFSSVCKTIQELFPDRDDWNKGSGRPFLSQMFRALVKEQTWGNPCSKQFLGEKWLVFLKREGLVFDPDDC